MPMGSSSSMKVHSCARGFWDNNNHQQLHDHLPSLTLGCKRFRPLAPKLANNNNNHVNNVNSFDLKSFIKPETDTRRLVSSYDEKKDSAPPHHVQQIETHPGGTRWNPTQEQIGMLEMLYKGGMRTPNAQQIEQITEQLAKYGKIEGKNVFYWFQNHKARERQKQKRNILGLSLSPTTPTSTLDASIALSTLDPRVEMEQHQETSQYKRKLREWTFEYTDDNNNNNNNNNNVAKRKNQDDNEGDQTLELFPLHPEGR